MGPRQWKKTCLVTLYVTKVQGLSLTAAPLVNLRKLTLSYECCFFRQSLVEHREKGFLLVRNN